MRRLAERLDAAINPLTVKAAQQSLRSRALFLSGCFALGLPLMLWLSYGLLSDADATDGREGQRYYSAVVGCLAFVLSFVLPLKAAHELQGEIKTRTLELLMLTNLSPWQLAAGRFQAVAMQIALLSAFVLPFAVAALALGGIGAHAILTNLTIVSLLSAVQCAAALLAMTMSLLSRTSGVLAGSLFAVQLAVSGIFSMAAVSISRLLPPLAVAWIAILLAWTALLLVRMTADVLTRGQDSTSAYSKLLLVPLFVGICLPAWLSTPAWGAPLASRELLVTCLCGLHFFGMLWSGASTRRATARLSRFWLLADGYLPTLAYVLALSGVWAIFADKEQRVLAVVFGAYSLFFGGLALLARSLARPRTQSGETYVVCFVLIAALDAFVALPLRSTMLGHDYIPALWHALFPLAMRGDALVTHWGYSSLPAALGAGCALLAQLRAAPPRRSA